MVLAIFLAQLTWGNLLQGDLASLFCVLIVSIINFLLLASCCAVFRAEDLFTAMTHHPALIFALLLLSTALLMAFTPPAFSWDGLSFWFRDAARVSNSVSNISFFAANDQPNTLIVYYSIVARGASGWANYFIAWDLFVLWVGSVSVAVSYSNAGARARAFTLLWFLLLPHPLLLNHVFLVGYAEMWIGALITVSPFLCDRLLLSSTSFLDKLLLGFVGFCFFAIKDSGFLYLAVVCAAAFLVFCQVRSKMFVSIIISCMLCLLAFSEISVDPLFGIAQPDFIVKLGGHSVGLDLFASGLNFNNFDSIVHAFLKNQSFSLTAILMFCFALIAKRSREAWTVRLKISISILFIGFAMICLLPLKIEYFYVYGAPATDTSFSRMFLPLLPLTGTLLAVSIDQISSRSEWRERTSLSGDLTV